MSRRRQTVTQPRSWHQLLTGKLPLEHETAMFILVNVLDFMMTYWMLMHRTEEGHMLFTESNPVAAYFLYTWGPIKGMLFLKLSMVVIVCLIAQIIALKKIDTARWLLKLGTVAVALVVIYSLTVYLKGLG